MEKSFNRINLRVRNQEAVQLGIMRREFKENLKRTKTSIDPDNIANNTALELFMKMSRHQIVHFMIQYCFAKKNRFVTLLVKMAQEGIPDIETYQNKYGDLEELENSQKLFEENYIDILTSSGPLTRLQYDKLMEDFESEENEK